MESNVKTDKKVKGKKEREALEKILNFVKTKSVFPLQDEYDRYFSRKEQNQILEDLGKKLSMKMLGITHPSAVFNIAVLRELRERKGETIMIANPGVVTWEDANPTLFENPVETE